MHLKKFQCGINVCLGIDNINRKFPQNFTLTKSILRFEPH